MLHLASIEFFSSEPSVSTVSPKSFETEVCRPCVGLNTWS